MLVNTDIQLALAQLGIITAIDKQLKEILQYVGGKRMVYNALQVAEMLRYMQEADEHLLKILRGEINGELYVVDKGKRLSVERQDGEKLSNFHRSCEMK